MPVLRLLNHWRGKFGGGNHAGRRRRRFRHPETGPNGEGYAQKCSAYCFHVSLQQK